MAYRTITQNMRFWDDEIRQGLQEDELRLNLWNVRFDSWKDEYEVGPG